MKINPRKCKNPSCNKTFTPTYSTVQPVCSPICAIEYNKIVKKKTAQKEWRKEKKVLKEKLETKTDVEKKLQKEINLIVRLLDKHWPCNSSGRSLGKNYDAGHVFSRGGNPQIQFHLLNIFAQSVHDNQWKSGNQLDFIERIGDIFGQELKEEILSLKGLPAVNLEKHELSDKISIARGIVKWIKLQDRKFTLKERIDLRRKFNQEIGIY